MSRPGLSGSGARPLAWGRASPGLILALILVVALLDVATPAGIVTGELLCLPILLAAMADEPRPVIATGAASMVAFALAAVLGAAPISPVQVWLPNRVIAALSLPAATAVAIALQRARLAAERGEKAALAARDLTRLLMSLLAHDLRAPLAVARDCLTYVEGALGTGEDVDGRLLADTVARLDRSLHAIGVVLSLPLRGDDDEGPRPVEVRRELEHVAAAFAREADARGKRIVLRLDAVRDGPVSVHPLVLRQVTGILIDNAVRYASPGEIVVAAETGARELVVRVEDAGIAASDAPVPAVEPPGLGMGLQLSRALAGQAGGSLTVEGGGNGYRCELRLPLVAAAAPAN